MTLPSQTARSIRVTNTRPASRTYRPRAVRRRRMALAVLLIAVVALVFGGWRWLTGLGEMPQSAVAAGDPGAEIDPNAMSSGETQVSSQLPITRDEPIGRSSRGEELERVTPREQPPVTSNTTTTNTAPVLTMGERTNPRTERVPTQLSSGGTGVISTRIEHAVESIPNDPLSARDALNRALHDPDASETERLNARRAIAALNEELFFSPRTVPGDDLSESYVVKSGDTLGGIASRNELMVDWRLLMRVNGITDARRIRVGQSLKLVMGPFHAMIDKSDYRLDMYSERTDSAGNRLLLTSYDIGLGEYGSTPIGTWIVRPRSKLLNPAWTNPRTGEQFGADDPENPIGECWLGLDGTDPTTSEYLGYGIHGTVEPDSIGRDESMGCIRLLPGDIDEVWELLVEGVSTVEIVP